VASQSFFDVCLVALVRLIDQFVVYAQLEVRLGQRLFQRRDPVLFALHDHLHDIPFGLEPPIFVQPLLHHRHARLRIPRGLPQ